MWVRFSYPGRCVRPVSTLNTGAAVRYKIRSHRLRRERLSDSRREAHVFQSMRPVKDASARALTRSPKRGRPVEGVLGQIDDCRNGRMCTHFGDQSSSTSRI